MSQSEWPWKTWPPGWNPYTESRRGTICDPPTFWSKCEPRSGPLDSDCLIPTWKTRQGSGYAMLQLSVSKKLWHPQLAHRYAYELAIGPIPDGAHIDHKCLVRDCVNPHHLQPVSPGENNFLGGVNRGIRYRSTPHLQGLHEEVFTCGHERTPANSWKSGRGGYYCKTCKQNYRNKVKQPQ